ncbi:FAD-dependent oxidoreductase [Janthinobacterium psychrotolerans]|uniref:Glycine/D-amino acid oxidase (Deaminating) n=1 Tax=Janthinobacterium psychrotolerans TaxID=1747903 RepID=A0A1A7C6C3_9BURK|nr:FAD-dependent oxidoreductase [Janthinobacterium psychrotolerans]OBV41262.1 Glycine/D-amino acid oxidase (deaminating) [Janthinobacterium psychrotolerans]
MAANSTSASTSIWQASTQVMPTGPLPADASADVCVIGAGIAGLSTAYLLSRQGLKVIVIDATGIGAGETGRTTAHFFPPDEWYANIEDDFGPDQAALVASSFASAIDMVEDIVRKEAIDCEFERLDGYLYALPGNGFRDFDKELAAALRAGVPAQWCDRVPGLPFDTGPGIRYRGQAQFHPLKYLNGLAQAIVKYGGKVHGATRALKLAGDNNMQMVSTEHGEIGARSVVVASNTPFNNRLVMHTKQAGYMTYVIGMAVPQGSLPRILLWDTGDPYYYVRLSGSGAPAGHEVLIVGGADHKVGQEAQPASHHAGIERWAREHFPMAGSVLYRWSGEVMEPADGPAFLGRNPMDNDNVYIITGDSGNGMTHATIGAMLVRDLILGRANPWSKLYAPSRKVIHGVSDFIGEQVNTLAQYRDWARGSELRSLAQLQPGQGAIVRQGLRKLAVYRNELGGLHVLSAACAHLGCVVHFNQLERSWDCPCHGSRFDIDGKVLHGPAATPLEPSSLTPPA